MNNSKQGPVAPNVLPTFPECDKYEVRNVDWREDRYAIFTEKSCVLTDKTECVVSGLTYAQTVSLMSHFKSLEE
jgi:hypothetical protein